MLAGCSDQGLHCCVLPKAHYSELTKCNQRLISEKTVLCSTTVSTTLPSQKIHYLTNTRVVLMMKNSIFGTKKMNVFARIVFSHYQIKLI